MLTFETGSMCVEKGVDDDGESPTMAFFAVFNLEEKDRGRDVPCSSTCELDKVGSRKERRDARGGRAEWDDNEEEAVLVKM